MKNLRNLILGRIALLLALVAVLTFAPSGQKFKTVILPTETSSVERQVLPTAPATNAFSGAMIFRNINDFASTTANRSDDTFGAKFYPNRADTILPNWNRQTKLIHLFEPRTKPKLLSSQNANYQKRNKPWQTFIAENVPIFDSRQQRLV